MNTHHTGDIDRDALGAQLEREAELHTPFLEKAARWLRELMGGDDGADLAVGRVLDAGSGPGVATCLLARTFPHADVVAVDQDPALLERVRLRAAKQRLSARVSVQRADLPGEFDALSPADLIWTSRFVHHLGHQQAALDALSATLRPGGTLAVVESGLPPRFLPRDIGMGRPGFQARLDAAVEDHFASLRAELPGSTRVVEDWPAMMARAGLVPTGSRTFLTDLPAPLELSAREHLHSHLSRLLERIGDRLDAEDRAVLERLVDGDACTGILWRPDAFYLAATTVHTARACTGR
ncbi:class I SAM-dependent methyltransferase [Streptomyces sp. HMX112]|uniref:class I SAM-dependent methyltransferase n=1 Tax=Streptomyces sp. HMX112 TaxID=3390850 RepID=UPI003A7F89F3